MEGYNVEGFKRFLNDIKDYIKNNYWFLVLIFDWLITDIIISIFPLLEPYSKEVNIFVEVIGICLLAYYLRNEDKLSLVVIVGFVIFADILSYTKIPYKSIIVIILVVIAVSLLMMIEKKKQDRIK